MSDDRAPTASSRGSLRPWKPGQSGNPKGRPKKSAEARAVDALARAESADALNVVLEVMREGEKDRDRLAAALAVIERGVGKPGDTLPVAIKLPAGATLAQRAEAIADAAMQGACSVAQASALLSCLASVQRVREIDELEQRIAALERREGATP